MAPAMLILPKTSVSSPARSPSRSASGKADGGGGVAVGGGAGGLEGGPMGGERPTAVLPPGGPRPGGLADGDLLAEGLGIGACGEAVGHADGHGGSGAGGAGTDPAGRGTARRAQVRGATRMSVPV